MGIMVIWYSPTQTEDTWVEAENTGENEKGFGYMQENN